MSYLSLISGFVILLFCGDLLVRGSVSLALKLGIPSILIGLTVVAFGTSAPELVVSIKAALTGAGGIAIGNVVGSNIANILFVLGLPAIIYPTLCNQDVVRRNTGFMVGATLLFIAFCLFGQLVFWQGVVLFTLVVFFLAYVASHAFKSNATEDDIAAEFEIPSDGEGLPESSWTIAFFLLIGVCGLPLGAHFIVEGGTGIARNFGVSDAAIGLSLIAFGTSLPELATTMVAAFRRQPDLAVGNVLGSNLFNILAIMGITTMVTPIDVPEAFIWFDLWVMLIAALVIVPFAMSRGTITRSAGFFFVVGYVSYLYFLFVADQAARAAHG
ncbi:MAG: calcium/sodium antiporter [Alphaproteobacteria bacterium]|nr:calcium/sodium antiporter [Alphaproteobacteria bacterium]MBO6627266.1 calcium/sodium antiporter [Alphaproteobacteria bacterium]